MFPSDEAFMCIISKQVTAAGGPWTPASLAGVTAWIDAANAATIFQDAARTTPVTADAQPVGGVADASGHGNHAQQGTAGRRPTYKVNQYAGKPCFRFTAAGLSVWSLPDAVMGGGSHTVLGVCYWADTLRSFNNSFVYGRSFFTPTFAVSPGPDHESNPVGALGFYANPTGGAGYGCARQTDAVPEAGDQGILRAFACRWDSAAPSMSVDVSGRARHQKLGMPAAVLAGWPTDGIGVGWNYNHAEGFGGGGWNWDLCELVVIDGATPGDADLAAWFAYAAGKWGTALPS